MTEYQEALAQDITEIKVLLSQQAELLGMIEGLLIFFVVALVCWLVYKFFRIFF